MNTQPFITVLMPVYNAGAYLKDSIDSILKQTYGNFEFLIINDASTDESEKVILSVEDKRIRYLKNEINSGVSATANRGIDQAIGKYVVRIDADDIAMPDRLEKQVLFMESNSLVGVSGTRAKVFGSRTGILQYETDDAAIRVRMLYECHMLQPSSIMRKELLDKHGLRYNPGYIVAEDYDLFYRIGKVSKLANLPEILLEYRKHQSSISTANIQSQNDISSILIKQQFVDLGLAITDYEIGLFTSVMHARFDFSETQLYEIEKLLGLIIEANEKSRYIEPSVLTGIIIKKWKDLLLNDTRPGLAVYHLGMKSPLFKYDPFSAWERTKLFIKALLKY